MMYRRLLLIAVILLLVPLPASAYSLIYENDHTSYIGGAPAILSGGGGAPHGMWVIDAVGFTNTTYIEFTGITGFKDTNLTGSYNTILKIGATAVGNATVAWNWYPGVTYSGKGDFYITIVDYNPGVLTGAQFITFKNVYMPNTYSYAIASTPAVALPSPFAAYFVIGTSANPINCTYKFYGGLPGPTVPPGYTRTTIFAVDGDTGATIVGASLNVSDAQTGAWTNGTSSATGLIKDVLSTHTLNIYGDYPGVYNASRELGATPGGNYYLPLFMYRPAPVGYVYLYVTARDAATGLSILHAPISTRLPTGAVEGSNSGSSGTASFLVPNNTIIVVSASPSGYNPISLSTTTTTVNKHVFIDLSRSIVPTSTVAPVVTDPATGAVIPQTTYLPYCDPSAPDYSASACSQSQDSDLMAILREWAPSLLILMILAWMFGLLKMIMKW